MISGTTLTFGARKQSHRPPAPTARLLPRLGMGLLLAVAGCATKPETSPPASTKSPAASAGDTYEARNAQITQFLNTAPPEDLVALGSIAKCIFEQQQEEAFFPEQAVVRVILPKEPQGTPTLDEAQAFVDGVLTLGDAIETNIMNSDVLRMLPDQAAQLAFTTCATQPKHRRGLEIMADFIRGAEKPAPEN